MAVPDDFGRLRVLLVDQASDGAPDTSWATLLREIPPGGGRSVPYELLEGGPDADGIRGVARVAVPARYRAHWGKVAEELRGQEVRVEATIRSFFLRLDPEPPDSSEASQDSGAGKTAVTGAALDLANLEKREAPRV